MDAEDIVLETICETRFWMNQLDALQPDLEVGLAQDHMRSAVTWLERISKRRFPSLTQMPSTEPVEDESSTVSRSAA